MSTLVDTLQPPPDEATVIQQLQSKVSPSKLSLFQSCRLKFFFRHVLGIKKPKSVALHVGATVHAVLKSWNKARWRQQTPSLADLHTTYTTAWASQQTDATVA